MNTLRRTSLFLVLSAAATSAQVIAPVGSSCAQSVRDTGGSGCLRASSTPTLGWLYPITNELFVDAATGHVGINTIFPTSRLSVFDNGAAPITTAATIATDSLAGTALRAQSQDGGIGVRGTADGTFPTGVVGNATDGSVTSGYFFNAGVAGTVSLTLPGGSFGMGVAGWANNPAGIDHGVYGETESETGGAGVFGLHDAESGTGAGVEGQTNAETSSAVGVRGVVASATPGGFSAGVRGENKGTGGSGIGVYGSQEGTGWGVYGRAAGAGIGVNGTAAAGGIGVFGSGSGGGFGVFSSGDFGGSGAKYFVQPHPTDAASEIRYVCLEGGESGTYFRGSASLAGGQAWIEVPADFRLVTDPEGLTVQVTPRGRAAVWVEDVSLQGVLVRGDVDVPFDYFVNGVRRGFADHEPVQENRVFVPRYRGVPFGAELRPEVREMLVANGVLNADYTPNETTAVRMGWTLLDAAAAAEIPRSIRRAADVHFDER